MPHFMIYYNQPKGLRENEIMITNNNHLWMNKETGELMTYDEMVQQAHEWYDLGDDTNACGLEEYYEDTGDDVPEDWYDESADIDDDCGFDPYAGCYTWDC